MSSDNSDPNIQENFVNGNGDTSAYHGHHAQTICADSSDLLRFKGQLLTKWGLCVYITIYNYMSIYNCVSLNAYPYHSIC